MNDYDQLANQFANALAVLIGNTHGRLKGSDSVTVTADGWIDAVIAMQRAIDWCRGLAKSHRESQMQTSMEETR